MEKALKLETTTYMTSSSSLVKNVIAVPCLPARPVRPAGRSLVTTAHESSPKVYQTYPMYVSLDRASHLEVDDKRDILHVDTAPSKVCRDQNIGDTRAQ
jgi:hypothetical protein